MSDHWNLLADLLGTPNLGNRSKKTAKTETTEPPASPTSDTSPKAKRAQQQDADLSKEGAAQSSGVVPDSKEPGLVQSEPPKERSMIQNSWDALANLFGISNDSSMESRTAPKETPVSKTPSQDAQAHPRKHQQSTRQSTREVSQDSSPSKAKRQTSSMWAAPEEPTVDRQNDPIAIEGHPQEPDLPSFSNSDSTAQVDRLQQDRRGPRRSPRRGRSEQPGRDSSTADSRPTRSNRQPQSPSQEFSEPRSNKIHGNGTDDSRTDARHESRQARNPRRPIREEQSGDPDQLDRGNPASQESRSADRRENRPRDVRETRDRQERVSKEPKSSQLEPTRRRASSGFAAGLSDQIDQIDERELNPRNPAERNLLDEDSGSSIRRKKRRGRTREEVGVNTENSYEGNDSDRDSQPLESRPRHSKIPTWAETIGFVIEANVANHQKQSSSSRGRPRRPNH